MNGLDKLISWVNPEAGLKRAQARAAIDIVRSYEAAAHTRRTKDWRATGTDANSELAGSLATLRNRSREQVRNNAYARRTVRVISTNVVGKGIVPTPEYVTRAAEKRIMKLWHSWADKKICDINGQLNFYGIQRLVMRTIVESGECLVVRRRANDTNMPLRLQVLEPDHIDISKGYVQGEDGSFTLYGIKFNSNGTPIGYWLFKEHPGANNMRKLTSDYYSADDVAHIFFVERPGQIRGVPWMVASMIRMKDFDEYEDAELVRQKIAACFTVFVQDVNPENVGSTTSDIELASRVEPGIIEMLPPGKTVTFGQPPVTNGYESYSKKILQGIAVGTGITYEQMTGDYGNVNFSSGRMGWIEFQRSVEEWQDDMVIPMLCDTVWKWFAEAGELVGVMKKDVVVSWTPPRREMLDPVKETNAINLMVRNGFMSYSEAVRQLGYDPDDTMEEIASDFAKLDEKGIVLDSDPRQDKKMPNGVQSGDSAPPAPGE